MKIHPTKPVSVAHTEAVKLLPAVQLDSALAQTAKLDGLESVLATDPAAAPSPVERRVQVAKGDTLADILVRAGVSAPEAHDAISAVATLYNPRSLKPGQALTLTFGPGAGGKLMRLLLPASFDNTVRVERGANESFNAARIALPLTHQVAQASGVIRSSLYEDAVAAGLPAPLVVELIRAFSYDVDFQREIQPGDRFEAAFERDINGADEVVHNGSLVYGALTLSGKTLRIYRYVTRDGRIDYFNAKGESVRKALLRTPVDGARLTSGFGMRINPILGFSMMHKGVDFGAPSGTPIMAAGDGRVDMAGWNGSYGNYVRLKHNTEYSTAYAHMSRIANGIRKDAHVRQGQIIGYIGETGRATGPHLHYEVLVHERQINPLSVKLPTGIKLAGTELAAFLAYAQKTNALLAGLASTNLARSSF
jgi:murein DD-endopeptidase MepM/ murein hydrolase activator NlpD